MMIGTNVIVSPGKALARKAKIAGTAAGTVVGVYGSVLDTSYVAVKLSDGRVVYTSPKNLRPVKIPAGKVLPRVA